MSVGEICNENSGARQTLVVGGMLIFSQESNAVAVAIDSGGGGVDV